MNLADLARAAVDKGDTNERLAVAKQSLSHAVRSRSTGEAMSQVAAAAEAPSRPVPAAETPLPHASRPPVPHVPPPAPSMRAPVELTPVPRRRRGRAVLYMLLVLIAGTAGAGFYLQRIQHPLFAQVAALVGMPVQAATPAPPPIDSVAQAAPKASAKPAEEAKPAEPAAAEPDAPAEEAEAAPGAAPRRAATRGGKLSAKEKAAAEKERAEASKKPAEEAAKPAPAEAKKEAGSLQSEIERRAQAAKEKKAEAEPDKAAAPQQESRALEPSTGDVSSAIARVRPAAQACLAGQSGNATASVTFGSDGRVQSVAVSGPAAGAAGGCVRNALSAARVSPFAKPSFTISTTIRPVVRAASD